MVQNAAANPVNKQRSNFKAVTEKTLIYSDVHTKIVTNNITVIKMNHKQL